MRIIPASLLIAVALTACGVKEDDLHQRLAPVERQTEELQTDQQALQERLAASEAEMQRLRAELDALRQPAGKGKKAVPPPKVVTAAPSPAAVGMAVPPPRVLTPAQAAEEDRKRQQAVTLTPNAAPGTATAALGTPPSHGPVRTSSAATASTTTQVTTPATVPTAPAAPLSSGSVAVSAPKAMTPPPIAARTTPVQPAKPEPVVPAVQPSNEQSAYRTALATYEKGRFAEAEQLFDQYLSSWPSGKLAPNALYWKGECLYSRGRSADAVFVFKDVLTRFPKHPKAPDALLKSIMTYRQLGDADNARLHYSVLQEDYPTSPALKRAREMGLDR